MVSSERRQDTVLRLVVEALQRAGYAVADRCSFEDEPNAVLLLPEGGTAEEHSTVFVLVTHEAERRCVSAKLYRVDAVSGSPQGERRLSVYYQPHHLGIFASLAEEFAADISRHSMDSMAR